jgi:hypothetical protein
MVFDYKITASKLCSIAHPRGPRLAIGFIHHGHMDLGNPVFVTTMGAKKVFWQTNASWCVFNLPNNDGIGHALHSLLNEHVLNGAGSR